MNWYTWPTRGDFESWHAQVVAALGLPRIGRNQATGRPAPGKQPTTAYTDAVEVARGDWRAPVGYDIAATYTDGLGTPSTPPPTPDIP